MCIIIDYSYVAVCTVRSVQYVVSLLFASVCYCLIIRLLFSFKYPFNVYVLFFVCFSGLCILCFCFVLCFVSSLVFYFFSLLFLCNFIDYCHRV
jgi:hypothetical protein